jgi:putative hemolysin
MKNTRLLSACLLILLSIGCQSTSSATMTLDEVPQAARDAALAAVPGLVLEEAETEVANGATVYCLEGKADGKEYEIEVTADGRVLEVESEDDDEAEDD